MVSQIQGTGRRQGQGEYENLAEHPVEFSKDYWGGVTQLKIRVSESHSLLVVIETYGNGWLR